MTTFKVKLKLKRKQIRERNEEGYFI